MIFDYIDKVKENGYFQYRRNQQSKYWMYESINEQLRNSFFYNPHIKKLLPEVENNVLIGKKTSFVAAQELLNNYFADLKNK